MPDVELQNPMIIPFTRGIDTKSDPKAVQAPFLLVCENGVLQKSGTIEPRPGFGVLPRNTNNPARAISQGSGLLSYVNELLEFDDQQLYSYSPATEQWVIKGPANSVQTNSQNVISNSFQQTAADWAINNNIAVYAWSDSRGGVRASVVDIASGVYYQSDILLNANGLSPRVVAAGDSLFVGYGDGVGNFRTVMLSIGTPSVFAPEKIFATDMDNTGIFDWLPFNGAIALCYLVSPGNLMVVYLTPQGYLGNPLNGYPAPAALTCQGQPTLIALINEGGAYLQIFSYAFAFTSITQNIVNTSLTPTGAHAAYGSGLLVGFTNLVGYFDANSPLPNINHTLYLEKTNFSITDQDGGVFTLQYPLSNGAAPGPPTVGKTLFKAGLGLGAKPFSWDSGSGIPLFYLVLTYASPLQSTYFIVGANGLVLSRHLYGQGGGVLQSATLPQVLSPTAGTFAWPGLKQGQLKSQNGTVFTVTGLSLESINFTAPARYQGVLLGQQIHIAGGIIQSYDSANLVEHGFLVSPETLAVTSTPTTGGSMSNGTYGYTYIYEWTDNKGQLHRSAASSPLLVTLSGGTATQRVILAVPPLRLTSKVGVVIAFFRTTDTGSVYFKASSLLSPVFNDPTKTSQSFTDTLSDASLQNNEILYTVGGELDNDPPPAATLIAVGKQRIWLAGSENPNVLYFSKQAVVGQGIGFSLALTATFDTTGGSITAIAIMDDKVIVWKNDLLWYFNGDGPNALGQNNSFTQPQLIASDVGCINPASVELTSEGLYFLSGKGIYLLTRSLQLIYIGAPAEAFNGQTFTSAQLMPRINQVRFGCSDGPAVVYNYFFVEPFGDQLPSAGQWSTFTNHKSVAACVWMGNYAFLKADGTVCVEYPDTDTDNGTPIVMRVRTGWLEARKLGFMNVPEIAVLGNYLSPHILQVRMAFDYQPYDTQVLPFDTRIGIPLSTFGDDDTFGGDSHFGGFGDNTYQFRCRIPQQQCEALQLEFSNIVPSGTTPGRCYSLNALAVMMELQEGLARLPIIKTI